MNFLRILIFVLSIVFSSWPAYAASVCPNTTTEKLHMTYREAIKNWANLDALCDDTNSAGIISTTELADNSVTAAKLQVNWALSGSEGGSALQCVSLVTNPTDCSANQYANAIDASGNLSCQLTVQQNGNTVSKPATCAVGNTYIDTQVPAICACTATNTWKCSTLS